MFLILVLSSISAAVLVPFSENIYFKLIILLTGEFALAIETASFLCQWLTVGMPLV